MVPIPMDPVSPQAGLDLTRFFAAGIQAGPQVGLRPVPPVMREDQRSTRAKQGDSVELSAAGLASLQAVDGEVSEPEAASGSTELSPEEQEQLRELQARDREVRAHEQAHKAAGGDLAGAPNYEYERGPDGNRYAVGGEVGISLREGSSAAETGQIAQRVRSAALAPAQPSGQDMAVAAKASQMAARARAQESEEKREPEESEQAQASMDPAVARAARAYGEVSGAEGRTAQASVAKVASTLVDLVA